MKGELLIAGSGLTLDQVENFLKEKIFVTLVEESRKRLIRSREIVLEYIGKGETAYGVNTGFGKLSTVRISSEELDKLQKKLLLSHACGVDKPVSEDVVRLMMLLKVNGLAAGYSGCSPEVVFKLVEFLNKEIVPVVPARGSVGASGDLAPLAHMSLPLIGMWECFYKGKRVEARTLIEEGLYEPIKLGPKDGISLINGTQFSTALLSLSFFELKKLIYLSELAASMSVEAMLATDTCFREEIHRVRRQKGQMKAARHLWNFLRHSEIVTSHKDCEKVQDPYSFRCSPQVFGVAWDAIEYVENVLEREINAVTDNPVVLPDPGEILSGGNFHAEPIAFCADMLAVAIAEIGNLSERRIACLIDSNMSGLPPFLTEKSGINSGFMLPHVTVASLVSMNRGLAHPFSVDNIPTSANQEDHVSMAPNACLRLFDMIKNLKKVVWVEFLSAAQGIDFRRPLKSGVGVRVGYEKVRSIVEHLGEDRLLYKDINLYNKLFGDKNFIEQVVRIAEGGASEG